MEQSAIGVFEVELPDTFEARLALVRRVRGWNQTQLADACKAVGLEMRQPVISEIEKGRRRANALERAVLAHALNVPASYFFVTEESHPAIGRMGAGELAALLRDIPHYLTSCVRPAETAVA